MARLSLQTIAWRSTAFGAALGLAGIVVVSCGSDVTCGSGTSKKGDQCVANATSTGDSGPTGEAGATGSANTPLVMFDGVTSVESTMTFSPPWTPDRMSEDAKFALGY